MNQRDIFTAAVQITDPVARAAYLEQACGGDANLRKRVEILLRTHDSAGDFLARPAVEELAGDLSAPAGEEVNVSRPQAPAQSEKGAEPDEAEEDEELAFLQPSGKPDSLGRLDHYEVLEVVGRGGMGVVLRARDSKLLRVVALKVLTAPLAASGTARQRFTREARAAAAVRDDHVIDIHAVCDDGPLPYLVMEYIDGCNLEALLRKSGPLEVKEILRIGIQIARGLAAAHQQGLIHRDVKPANILLENGVQRVKLTDFGLARAADDASLTQSGLIAGTPLYMAPEQAVGEPIGPRADLFSLGSVLYELSTGRAAFRAPTTVAVLRRVCDETPPPIREVNPDIPEPLCQLIERLQAKKPADRPASANEVADLLAGLLAGLQGQGAAALSAGTPSLPAPRRPKSSRPWLWIVAALVLLVVGLGVGEATGVTDVRGTVIRLFSPEGTLVVEVDDPGVSVTVDGGDVVITGAGAKEIRLKPGQYKIEASKDGKVVSRELVTVSRNGRQVVRISKEAEPLTKDERWEKSVAALPAEKQVEAVARRLQELNPGFGGRVIPTIENGIVRGLKFSTANVDDLSPLRALRGLALLHSSGPWPKEGKLSDLGPLRGLPLKTLICGANPIADLSPLRGMPLTDLACGSTRVSDLTPLKGMRLESLVLMFTRTADLGPLRGMPLKELHLDGLHEVSDLSPLKGMPLEILNLWQVSVSDVAVLGEIKSLRDLVLTGMPVSDLSPLRGLPLSRLSLRGTPVSDLSPLKTMPLKRLDIDYRSDREELLRSLKGLEFINDKPVAEFWKDMASK